MLLNFSAAGYNPSRNQHLLSKREKAYTGTQRVLRTAHKSVDGECDVFASIIQWVCHILTYNTMSMPSVDL